MGAATRGAAGSRPGGTSIASTDLRVHAVVLNYLHVDDTLRCVASLRASTYRTLFPIVVDNGSGPEAEARLRAELGATTFIATGSNLGYAAGNNVGIRHALERGADLVWILNPDTVVEPDALALMLETVQRRPRAGIVGSLITNGGSSPLTVSFAGGTIDFARGGMIEQHDVGRPVSQLPASGPRPTDYATGSSMVVRREVFDDIGPIPEHYFLYYEETDFNVRAARAGWELLIDLRARVHHHRRSFGALPAPYYVYYLVRNRIHFGREFTDRPVDTLVEDAQDFIGAWRAKVARADPTWSPTYERLVSWAIEDARAGRTGPRPEVDAMAKALVGA